MTDLVVISDTHGMHQSLVLPEGDVLIHCGDFSKYGSREEAERFAEWFEAQEHPCKILVPGNHDWSFFNHEDETRSYFEDTHILIDQGVELCGMWFWGFPWTMWCGDCAYLLQPGFNEQLKTNLIPEEIDVLISHGPPREVLDLVHNHEYPEHCGSEWLRKRVVEIQPDVHVFGHIHEGYGQEQVGKTLFVNAAVLDERYQLTNQPQVISL